MASKIDDIEIGRTARYRLEITDNGTAVDITGWNVAFMMKSSLNDADVDAVVDVTTTVGSDPSDDALNGIVYLTVNSDQTVVALGTYYYDFVRIITGTPDDVKTLLSGKVKVVQPVRIDT